MTNKDKNVFENSFANFDFIKSNDLNFLDIWKSQMDAAKNLDFGSVKFDPLHIMPSMMQWMQYWQNDPKQFLNASTSYMTRYFELVENTCKQMAQGLDQQNDQSNFKVSDRRFKDERWHTNPMFNLFMQVYKLTEMSTYNWICLLYTSDAADD